MTLGTRRRPLLGKDSGEGRAGLRSGTRMLDHPFRNPNREFGGFDRISSAQEAGEERPGEGISSARRIDELVRMRRNMVDTTGSTDERPVGVKFHHD
ncbi:MAG: hypothetical protein RL058_1424, partial [Actinomycetota bacterium]